MRVIKKMVTDMSAIRDLDTNTDSGSDCHVAGQPLILYIPSQKTDQSERDHRKLRACAQ